MEVLLGKNGYIQFYKEGDYRDFACCETVSINFSSTSVSVKTLGDGMDSRTRKRSKSYTISLTGLIPIDETMVHTFDLLEYYRQSVDILYQLVFEQNDGTVYKVIRGTASVDTLSIDSPVDFVGSSIELTGQGPYDITNVADVCIRTIVNLTSIQQADPTSYRITIQNISGGQVGRYDYSLDGKADQTSLGGRWFLNGVTLGGHILRIWPVCDNGIKGDLFTLPFTRAT